MVCSIESNTRFSYRVSNSQLTSAVFFLTKFFVNSSLRLKVLIIQVKRLKKKPKTKFNANLFTNMVGIQMVEIILHGEAQMSRPCLCM